MSSFFNRISEIYTDIFSLEYHQFEAVFTAPVAQIIPLTAIVLYFAMMHFLPKMIPEEGYGNLRTAKDKKAALWWKNLYFAWNMFLCVFSVMMLLGVGVPFYRYIFTHGGFLRGSWHVICNTNGEASYLTDAKLPIVFWGWLFTLSKYVELFDTVLLIMKNPKRKILLLHWLHHWSVLLITWHIGYYRIPVGWFYLTVNAFIHSWMYYYYAMTEIGRRPTWGFYLTIGQTVQMIVGTIVNVLWFYGFLYAEDYGCVCQRGCKVMFTGIGIMYVTYFVLFAKFFVEKYYGSTKSAKKDTSSVNGKKTVQHQRKKSRKLE